MSNTALTNMSLGGWFSEMEADDFDFADQGLMNSPIFSPLDEFPQEIVMAEGEKLQQSSSSDSCTSHPTSQKRANPNFTPNISTFGFSQNGFERPCKQIKTQSHHSSIIPKSSSNTFQISFGNTNSNSTNTDKIDLQPKPEVVSDEYINFFPWNSNKKLEAPKSRPPSRDQEHVIAERKRREKLNQQFIDLAAIVPGLKKMDKASVLGDAVKYLKQLQERVKLLQEQTSRKSEERVILLNKSIIRSDHRDSSSWDENFDGEFKEALPEIEARISENNLLVRIHCEQRRGLASKFLSTIEKLHLSVVNSSFLPFGQYTMDITIVAQMDAEFSITVKDLVKNLRDVCVNDK